ncbi:MAG: ABC transporter permease [Tannerellaceae bacterium]|jgi:hypothetical protein|nr:ABC transporter permease [Tannerellaceae bacterium]
MKTLITQIWNRRRSNLWLIIELTLVFALVWFMTDYFFVLKYNLSIPNCRNIDNAWQITVGEYPEQAPEYRPEEATATARLENHRRILDRLKNYPGVEAVVSTNYWSLPGSSGVSASGFLNPSDTLKIIYPRMITFDATGDYFRVFGHTTDLGSSQASVRNYDLGGAHPIIICRSVAKALKATVGQTLWKGNSNSAGEWRIVGIIDDTKRFDYRRPDFTVYFPENLDTSNISNAEIAVRLTSSAPAFIDAFRKEMQDNFRFGNYYFKKMTSMKAFAQEVNATYGLPNDIRLRIFLMIFLLVNILLCVTGTFWYRVNKRREETGIRKALGASQLAIRRQFILEGLILLLIAAIPAMLIEANLFNAGLIETMGREELLPETYLPDRPLARFIIVNIISLSAMAAVVAIAIWLPARSAASMQAADALRYE